MQKERLFLFKNITALFKWCLFTHEGAKKQVKKKSSFFGRRHFLILTRFWAILLKNITAGDKYLNISVMTCFRDHSNMKLFLRTSERKNIAQNLVKIRDNLSFMPITWTWCTYAITYSTREHNILPGSQSRNRMQWLWSLCMFNLSLSCSFLS